MFGSGAVKKSGAEESGRTARKGGYEKVGRQKVDYDGGGGGGGDGDLDDDEEETVKGESPNMRRGEGLADDDDTVGGDEASPPVAIVTVDMKQETLEEKKSKLETLKLLMDTIAEVTAFNKSLEKEIKAVVEEHQEEEKIGSQKQRTLREELDRLKKALVEKHEDAAKKGSS